jgi:hypothetical protein
MPSHQIFSKSTYFDTNKTRAAVPTSMQTAVKQPPSSSKSIDLAASAKLFGYFAWESEKGVWEGKVYVGLAGW